MANQKSNRKDDRKCKSNPSNRSNRAKNYRRAKEIVDTGDKIERDDYKYEKDSHKARPNDWRWYANNQQLLKDFANFPYGAPVGRTVPGYYPTANSGSAVPGLCTIELVPSIGVSKNENSAINVSARNIYSYVRHRNSGSTNYEAPDLMIYLMAMDSIYSFLSWMKRLYGLMMDYTPYNRYYPKLLAELLVLASTSSLG